MTNECLLVCLCYHFVIFSNIEWSEDLRNSVGQSAIVFVIGLLAVNTLIILLVNFVMIKRKCRTMIIKRRVRQIVKKRQLQYLLELEQQQRVEVDPKSEQGQDRFQLEEPPLGDEAKKVSVLHLSEYDEQAHEQSMLALRGNQCLTVPDQIDD